MQESCIWRYCILRREDKMLCSTILLARYSHVLLVHKCKSVMCARVAKMSLTPKNKTNSNDIQSCGCGVSLFFQKMTRKRKHQILNFWNLKSESAGRGGVNPFFIFTQNSLAFVFNIIIHQEAERNREDEKKITLSETLVNIPYHSTLLPT